ncbi:MAG: CHAT domain-containing protein [Acidobacteriota bacterium]|nr:CHAT domain-containing protein [Acidobacteriota bacterium]
MEPHFNRTGTPRHSGTLPENPSATPDCPDLAAWMRLLNRQLPHAEADALLDHCFHCDDCLEVLKHSSAASATRLSALAEGADDPFITDPAQWRHRLAVELAMTPARRSAGARMRTAAWWTVSLACLALAVVGIAVWRSRQSAPEQQLALAYRHDRFFDLRIPGAPYAPRVAESHSRGNASGHADSTLLSARATIEQHLEQSPADAHWLALRARADLLGENYDDAIDILDRFVAAGNATPALLADDATAYFQRGVATGSENDRATALDYLRRADEMAPDNPVVLFNEALVMEDRAQLINAVETWNRYLKFERDPEWLAEGRKRLEALETRLNQLKSHQSRINRRLATPDAMRALAADKTTLAALDEELTTTLLPPLLDAAFPMPADRSRGSPCPPQCSAARLLLSALAASLEHSHNDPWLHQLLPDFAHPTASGFISPVRSLAAAIQADNAGDHRLGLRNAQSATGGFVRVGNAAGAARSQLEAAYAAQRLGKTHTCSVAARALLPLHPEFAWIHIGTITEAAICDEDPGAASRLGPLYQSAASLATAHQYQLLAMRVQNQMSGSALEAGDVESVWRISLQTMQQFDAGDYPPFRAYTILAALAEAEKSSPRTHLELLLQRELLSILELTPSTDLIPSQRYDLAIAAIRAGSVDEAQRQLAAVRAELAQQNNEQSIRLFLADSEIALANLYLARHYLSAAAPLLRGAQTHIAGLDDGSEQAALAAATGQLDLALGQPGHSESALRRAIVQAEARGAHSGDSATSFARQNRTLYATLAGLWLAQGRPDLDILALWERLRLRSLGAPVPVCPGEALNCLAPQLRAALAALPAAHAQLHGEILLPDRILDYQATGDTLQWTQRAIPQNWILDSGATLGRDVESLSTSIDSVSQAAQRMGQLLLPAFQPMPGTASTLLIESDPLLGNLPWPAVETAAGPLGLVVALQELPSLLMPHAVRAPAGSRPLIVGASIGAGRSTLLPEALDEARAVAALDPQSSLLLATHATRSQIERQLPTASLFHFAGHTAQQEGATRLLLSPSGASSDPPYLDAADLRQHPPRAARLVVLSACSTGRDTAAWDHGMSDMVDTLAEDGVPEVVATRWTIDSASAVVLMRAFYSNLALGLAAPQSLTLARQALAQDPHYRHPYYWAGYYASGEDLSGMQSLFHAPAP